MHIAFADTNLFLQYREPSREELARLLQTSEVALGVCLITLKELNQAKDGSRSNRLRKRAQKALVRLENALEERNPLYRFVDKNPTLDFQARQLNPTINDDVFIATVIEQAAVGEVVVLTADVGARLAARGHGLEVMKPPEEWRLPPEPSDLEKDLLKARKEIAELRSAQPRVELVGPPGPLEWESYEPLTSEEITREFTQLAAKNQRMEFRHMFHGGAWDQIAAISGNYPPTESEISEYNREQERWLLLLQEFQREAAALWREYSLHFQVEMKIVNGGGVPADDIDLWLELKGSATWVNESERPPEPSHPRPPVRPSSAMTEYEKVESLSRAFRDAALGAESAGLHRAGGFGNPRRETAQCVRFKGARLKHGSGASLAGLWIRLDDPSVEGVQVKWRANVGNVPRDSTGVVNLRFELSG